MPLLKPRNKHLAGAYEVADSITYLDPIEDTDGIPFKEVEAPWQAAIGSDQEALNQPYPSSSTALKERYRS